MNTCFAVWEILWGCCLKLYRISNFPLKTMRVKHRRQYLVTSAAKIVQSLESSLIYCSSWYYLWNAINGFMWSLMAKYVRLFYDASRTYYPMCYITSHISIIYGHLKRLNEQVLERSFGKVFWLLASRYWRYWRLLVTALWQFAYEWERWLDNIWRKAIVLVNIFKACPFCKPLSCGMGFNFIQLV